MRACTVQDPSHSAETRRAGVALAVGIGFDEAAAGRVAIVATELATNLLKHGGGGVMLIGTFTDETGSGLEVLALDKGPGIADIAGAMRDGFSSAGSSGTGLGAVARQSHHLDMYSRIGGGLAVLARLQRGRLPAPGAPTPVARYGAVTVPKPGEEVCGDGWAAAANERGLALMIADGLGHGPLAASAAQAGMRCFADNATLPPGEVLARMHIALRPTRGAACSVAEVRPGAGSVVFAGIGNVSGSLVAPGGTRRMVSHNGTLGHVMRRVQEFTYPLAGATLLVLCSDGLGTGWTMDAYPGLHQHHPSLVAGVIYRDFARGHDDATVLVARVGSA